MGVGRKGFISPIKARGIRHMVGEEADMGIFARHALFRHPALHHAQLGRAIAIFPVDFAHQGVACLCWASGNDIGNAQQYFGRLGKLSRIDLRFKENADAGSVRAAVEPTLPMQVLWSVPQAAGQRMSNLSRAYRVNLNVLALVALFTGAFIVQATLALRVARQQHEIALLGVLGAPRRFAAKRILIDALAIGALGSVTGVLGGMALASLLLAVTGGDLGGGYFDRRVIALAIDPLSVAAGLAGGLAIALMGAFSPGAKRSALA